MTPVPGIKSAHNAGSPPTFRSRKWVPARAGAGPLVESGEHVFIGNDVTLFFEPGAGVSAANAPLHLANGLALQYGQVLALAGDFYGVPSAPISDGADHQARFRAAFSTLAVDPKARVEAPRILAVMDEEAAAVAAALLAGKPASAAYAALGLSLSAKWNAITGGGSPVSPWLPEGRYLQLAQVDWDHFGENAVVAYSAGHQTALERAASARGESSPERRRAGLEQAYALDAFAAHFLTDLFSSGHLRTPRKELYQLHQPSSLTGLLAKYMHDEDGANGLYVRNRRGERWVSYGDDRYFDNVSSENVARIRRAVQASVDEVFDAYTSGTAATGGYAALALIPDLAALADHESTANYSALFIPKGDTVYARDSYSDLNVHRWTRWWTTETTLAELTLLDHDTTRPAGYLVPPVAPPEIIRWNAKAPGRPWIEGVRVRYAISFFDLRAGALNESMTGPWCPFATCREQFEPTVAVPTDPSGRAQGRRIYRQFLGGVFTRVGQVDGNAPATFTDR